MKSESIVATQAKKVRHHHRYIGGAKKEGVRYEFLWPSSRSTLLHVSQDYLQCLGQHLYVGTFLYQLLRCFPNPHFFCSRPKGSKYVCLILIYIDGSTQKFLRKHRFLYQKLFLLHNSVVCSLYLYVGKYFVLFNLGHQILVEHYYQAIAVSPREPRGRSLTHSIVNFTILACGQLQELAECAQLNRLLNSIHKVGILETYNFSFKNTIIYWYLVTT